MLPDEAVVRVGDIVNIPVLAHDSDPNGQPLKMLQIVTAPSSGTMFVDQDRLRFIAGDQPGTFTAIYRVANSIDSGSPQFGSAAVNIQVLPADPGHNQAPVPKPLTGRVIAGTSTNIDVPLDGIDPDGDSVELVGIDKAPGLGTAIVASNSIRYTAASSSAGTDTLTYKVRDRLGAESTGTVRVGVAPIQVQNHPPVANDDVISMRPGRNVALDVLLNDSDPDGDPLGVVPDKFEGPAEMKPHLSEQGRVIVTSPKDPGDYTMNYTISDGKGGTSNAHIKMKVTPDSPLKAPIASDDHFTEQETLGKTAVDVPVLKNDEDPDGTTDDVKLSLDPTNSTASIAANGNIRVSLTQESQLIPYTITDVDNLTAKAIIWVPGLGKQYPVLKPGELDVVAGQSVTLDLNEHVKVRDGKSPRVTQIDRVTLIGASSQDAVAEGGTKIVYQANSDFYGKGSITFEVTDGNGPNDPEGLKSTLTVWVNVKPDLNNNRPPVFSGTSLNVAKGEQNELDLGTLAQDPDSDDNDKLKFSFDGDQPKDFEASLDGKKLKVTVKGDVQPGATGILPLKVSDGHNHEVKASITLVVTSTNKPWAVANDDSVPDALAGRSQTESLRCVRRVSQTMSLSAAAVLW
ncbi:Ig-like domain-containing protein [Renibacterium salmoninarum]|uniref:Ig-like domain-containing protein n=1 Tax=Renibacterium salmoninarum TaxID=1646 RepID=UPI0002DF1E4D|nr:Ig-like domain-containing protein [Renibacterium salmoninarum]